MVVLFTTTLLNCLIRALRIKAGGKNFVEFSVGLIFCRFSQHRGRLALSTLPILFQLNMDERKINQDPIETLGAQFDSKIPTADKPLTIGFIGHTNITRIQACSCRQQLQEQLESIDKLKMSGVSYWVEMVSPLAPGSDMVLIEEAMKILASGAFSIAGVRLLVPYAVSWDQVYEDFQSHWAQGNYWLNRQSDSVGKGGHSEWIAFKETLENERSRLIDKMRQADFPVDIIDLRSNEEEPLSSHDGYIRAAQWIVAKSEILIAVLDDKRKGTATDEWVDGGTGHTVAQWERLNKGQLCRIDPMRT